MIYLSSERKEETDMELLEEILNQENLNKAYKKVYQNKGASGVDGITVEEIADYIKENKERITNQIRNRKYKPQPVRRVQIPKENGKKRNLGIPTVMDRIIQQAMVQVISPIYEKQFNNNSYGFRPGRSCEQAVIKALEYLNDWYDWIIDIDLEKFFDTVNQDRLITKRYKALRQLGVSYEIAFTCANTRKGYYQICKTTYIQFEINTERLRKRGLVFLLDQYTKVHIECTD